MGGIFANGDPINWSDPDGRLATKVKYRPPHKYKYKPAYKPPYKPPYKPRYQPPYKQPYRPPYKAPYQPRPSFPSNYAGGPGAMWKGENISNAAESISPATIRFSQSSVNGVEEIAASMRANGWKGAPIDVVRMSDGGLTAFDNTRVLAASRAGINVQAIIREATEVFPAGRWTPKSGIQPATWEEAIAARIQQQNRIYRQTYPNGSAVTGSTQ